MKDLVRYMFDIPAVRSRGIGFDRLFDDFDQFFNNPQVCSGYPPYNIVKKDENSYVVEVALAGFKKDQIEVYTENGYLKINGTIKDKEKSQYHVKNIATRNFTLSLRMAENTTIGNISFEDGMLNIEILGVQQKSNKKVYSIS